MKLRLGAALVLAAITPLTVVTASSPAHAGGTDITPPEVGSCHDLTYDEYYHGKFEPEPAVDCAERHTSFTVRVKEYDSVPDWADAIYKEYVPCLKDLVTVTGGDAAQVQMTAYMLTFYRPTRAQQRAGAAWLRCDAVLRGGPGKLAPVPADVQLDGVRPPENVRKCRLGKRTDYALTVCTRRHEFVAFTTVKMQGRNYPGERAAKRFASRKCFDRIGDPAGGDPYVYEWVPNRIFWRAGYRSAVCSPLDQ